MKSAQVMGAYAVFQKHYFQLSEHEQKLVHAVFFLSVSLSLF
jgi:hypothetical protein